MASRRNRLVRYSQLARLDITENYNHSTLRWGIRQAEEYSKFLINSAQDVADEDVKGRPLEVHPGANFIFVRWKNARYGHNVIFVREPEGIYVLRILHSSMDVTSQELPAIDTQEEESE